MSNAASNPSNPSQPISFAIVGGGWRAEFYLRIAAALPERFRVMGVLVRDASKRDEFAARWQVPVVASLDEIASANPVFVVVSVPWAASPVVLRDLSARGIPTLAETPPAPDLEALVALWNDCKTAKVQVAEQYHLQPLHAARLHVVASGRIGEPTQAQVSVAHGYHGISLIRRLLGLRYENASIRAHRYHFPIVVGPDRDGLADSEVMGQSLQNLALFEFGDKFGLFDFDGEQYRSWIRAPRLLVRGERGEISNSEIRYLRDFRHPIEAQFKRRDAGQNGNLEGYCHQGITLGEEWVYTNPFVPARLTDDEIAIASCLDKMADYANGGPDFYSLGEASQDHYLSLLMQESIQSGQEIKSTTQPWADAEPHDEGNR